MTDINVLYVEDEIALAKITSDTLKKNNFTIVWCEDGNKAMEIYRVNSFDICVVDIMMPKMDGYSLVKKIRSMDSTVPIIFLTARTLTEDLIKGFEVGGNDYLKKPFNIEELIVRIRELVKRNKQLLCVPEIYTIGRYLFDYKKMELVCDKIPFSLTHRENEIIRRLVEKKQDILYTAPLVRELWGDDNLYNIRSFNVFITRIRKHFSSDKDIRILNVRSIGYRLVFPGSLSQ